MSRVLVFLFVSVVLTADMSSGEYYSLTLEEYRLDPVLEELRQGIIMGIEPHMISRLVREIRKQYGYR